MLSLSLFFDRSRHGIELPLQSSRTCRLLRSPGRFVYVNVSLEERKEWHGRRGEGWVARKSTVIPFLTRIPAYRDLFSAGRSDTITSSRLPASINLSVRCEGVKRFDLDCKATLIPVARAIETAPTTIAMERYWERCSQRRGTMFSSVRSLSNNRERTFSRVKIIESGSRGKRYYVRGTRVLRCIFNALPTCSGDAIPKRTHIDYEKSSNDLGISGFHKYRFVSSKCLMNYKF